MIALVMVLVGLSYAQNANGTLAKTPPAVVVEKPPYGGQLVIPVNKSQFLHVQRPYKELSIGNPDVADVVALSEQSLYVLGKKIGSTNLAISDNEGKIISVLDVMVSYDISAMKANMYALAPKDKVEVRLAGESVVLSGRASSAGRLHQLVQVAEQYAPGKVTNMMTVSGSQQVLLKVRFAEVQRSVLKDIGFSHSITGTPSNDTFSVDTGNGLNPERFFTGVVDVVAGDFSLLSTIDLLESKGLVHTLAEPNIIALSGDKANFLAGGEFPIPVAQDSGATNDTLTVQFKEFGVGLAFTPTVVEDDAINLQLDAEVSSIDPTVSVDTGAIEVPGLKVRKASTTVELKDGQSFAIAGLIEDNFEDTINAVPGLSKLPIIGALARSTDFMRHQSELVVIIGVHLVQPVTQTALASPTDRTRPPSEADLFLMGETEKEPILVKAPGIDGPYGYILP